MMKQLACVLLLLTSSCSMMWRDANRHKEQSIRCPSYAFPIAGDIIATSVAGYITHEAINQSTNGKTDIERSDAAIISVIAGIATFYYFADTLGGTYEHFQCR